MLGNNYFQKRERVRLRTTFIAGIAISLIASLAVITPAHAQTAKEKDVVRVGTVYNTNNAGIILADALGYLDSAGIKIEQHRMGGTPPLLAALATNQMDVVGVVPTPSLFLAVDQGIDLRVVGEKGSVSSLFPGSGGSVWLVARKSIFGDSKSPEDRLRALKGKTVAVNSRLGSNYFNLYTAYKEAGMALSDSHVVELTYPNQIAALSSGAVDAGFLPEPSLTLALRNPELIVINDFGGDADGELENAVSLAYSEGFAKKKELAQRFMTAYVRGVRAYLDMTFFGSPADKERVIDLLSKYLDQDKAIIRDTVFPGLDPNQKISVNYLNALQDFYFEQGSLPKKIDLSRLIDASFAEAAVKELGPYDLKAHFAHR
jgi:NitT/TauT family transport system substrate-binding protein